MADTTLATFRIEQSLWDNFKTHCSQNGDSASSRIIKLILADMGKSENLTPLDDNLDKRIESHLESHLDKLIDKASRTESDEDSIQRLDRRIDHLREEITCINVDELLDSRIDHKIKQAIDAITDDLITRDEVAQAISDAVSLAMRDQVSELFLTQIGELKSKVTKTVQRIYTAENNSKLLELMDEQIKLAKQVENLSRLFDNASFSVFRPLFNGINNCREKLGLRPLTLNEVSFSEFKRMSKGKHSLREREIALFEEKAEAFRAEIALPPENNHQTDLTHQDNDSPVGDEDPQSEPSRITASSLAPIFDEPENEPIIDNTPQNNDSPSKKNLEGEQGRIKGQSTEVTENYTLKDEQIGKIKRLIKKTSRRKLAPLCRELNKQYNAGIPSKIYNNGTVDQVKQALIDILNGNNEQAKQGLIDYLLNL